MSIHILSGQELTTGRRKPTELVAEYETKREMLPAALKVFNQAGSDLKMAATIGGTWGQKNIDTGRVMESDLERSLLCSAWRHVYELYQFNLFASPKDQARIERMFEKPEPFTLENIIEWFGAYVEDPRGSILKGLAEAFSDLDPSYKSHEKVRIGKKGLPKRVILSSVGSYGGTRRLTAALNALAVYQGKPLLERPEIDLLMRNGDALRHDSEYPGVGRDIWLRRFANGNGHLYFGPTALRDINLALAEYYGDVLPDTPDEAQKRRAGTEVSKDLQYYPTPVAVVQRMIADAYSVEGKRVLEPQCGCGRIMDGLRAKGADVFGIEIDLKRANEAWAKGHAVHVENFLETTPTEDFDFVFMNPPFYGRHYAKHVRHAIKFLKPGGVLYAILPITARHDHGELDEFVPRWGSAWTDLPMGSFRESGTNINTTIFTYRKPEKVEG